MEHFILSSIDPLLGCRVLEAIIPNPDIDVIRTLAGVDPSDDPDGYTLYPDEARAIAKHFNVAFEPMTPHTLIWRANFDLKEPVTGPPYLIHTGIELFLMLDGRKPFALSGFPYPPQAGEDEVDALFEPYVKTGRIIKRVVIETFDKPVRESQGRIFDGMNNIYYALPGEEWRIDAYLLLCSQSIIAGWNEVSERMMGSLLGYTDLENDWWIADLRHRGRIPWGLITVYATVNDDVLEWIRSSGYRALPWDAPESEIELQQRWPMPETDELNCWMEQTGAVAIIRLGLNRKFLKGRELESESKPWIYRIAREAMPELNRALGRSIEIICERHIQGN